VRDYNPLVPSELSRTDEATHEENLLIEAVSLLVQRQRETESWVAEQVWQAEERATEAERRYADLETRLMGIEEQLDRLLREVEPGRSAAVDERLARLREQVEGLKSASDGRSVRAGSSSALTVDDEPLRDPEPVVAREPDRRADTRAAGGPPEREAERHYEPRDPDPRREERRPAGPPRRAAVAAAHPQSVGFLELLGASPQDRWGFVLIVAGAVAVVYAVLSQLFR
jgi:hypothetical protein